MGGASCASGVGARTVSIVLSVLAALVSSAVAGYWRGASAHRFYFGVERLASCIAAMTRLYRLLGELA